MDTLESSRGHLQSYCDYYKAMAEAERTILRYANSDYWVLPQYLDINLNNFAMLESVESTGFALRQDNHSTLLAPELHDFC